MTVPILTPKHKVARLSFAKKALKSQRVSNVLAPHYDHRFQNLQIERHRQASWQVLRFHRSVPKTSLDFTYRRDVLESILLARTYNMFLKRISKRSLHKTVVKTS